VQPRSIYAQRFQAGLDHPALHSLETTDGWTAARPHRDPLPQKTTGNSSLSTSRVSAWQVQCLVSGHSWQLSRDIVDTSLRRGGRPCRRRSLLSPHPRPRRHQSPCSGDHLAHPDSPRIRHTPAPETTPFIMETLRGRPTQPMLASRRHPLAPGRSQRRRNPRHHRRPLPGRHRQPRPTCSNLRWRLPTDSQVIPPRWPMSGPNALPGG
jgi:hypothetical protein